MKKLIGVALVALLAATVACADEQLAVGGMSCISPVAPTRDFASVL
jgi:hypothetical protein